MTAQVFELQVALKNTCLQIDGALDRGDRRAFKVWCRKRANLIARLESTLLAIALTPQPAR